MTTGLPAALSFRRWGVRSVVYSCRKKHLYLLPTESVKMHTLCVCNHTSTDTRSSILDARFHLSMLSGGSAKPSKVDVGTSNTGSAC